MSLPNPFASGKRWRDTHPSEGELMAYADRQIPADEARRIQDHLARCSSCERAWESLRAFSAKAQMPVRPLPASLLAETKSEMLRQFHERTAALPSDGAIRAALGRQFSLRAGELPQEVRAAIQTMIGSPHSPHSFRLMPHFVWFGTGLYFAIAFSVWLYWIALGGWSATSAGNFAAMATVFGTPYKIFLILAAATATVISFGAAWQFEQKHPLRAAWILLAVAAACRMVGESAGILPTLLRSTDLEPLRPAGQLITGPISAFSLGFGLLMAYQAYRSVGLNPRLKVVDWLMLSTGALLTVHHASQIFGILKHESAQHPFVVLNWLSDPSLLFILTIAVPLRRIAVAQGGGLVANCWSAMTAGALLTFLGNFMLFLESYGYVPWPCNSVIWLVWLPASAALTAGPAYQFAANGLLAPQTILARNTQS